MTSYDETDETRSDTKSLALFFEMCRLSVARETTVVTGFVIPATHGVTFIVRAELVIPYATQIRTYFMVHNERCDCNGGEDGRGDTQDEMQKGSKPNGTASLRDARCGDTFPRDCPFENVDS